MKVGRIPAAAIILIVFALTSIVLNHFYTGDYAFDSPFMRGAFLGAIFVYFLYYVNIWVTSWSNNRKEAAGDNL